jgi:hypothetical protein
MTDIALPENRAHPGQEVFLRALFHELRVNDVRYCVMHSSDTLPYGVPNDLDLAATGIDINGFEHILKRACTKSGWEIVQLLWYDVPKCCYYVARSTTRERCFAAVDILIDENGIGRYGFSTSQLVLGAVDNGDFIKSASEAEFCYKITKRIRKGFLKPGDADVLTQLYANGDRQRIYKLLRSQYGGRGARLICNMIEDGRIITGAIPAWHYLSFMQLLRCRYANIGAMIRRSFWQLRRVFFRVANPSGMVLYIPGMSEPDLARLGLLLGESVGPAFRRVRLERKPGWLTKFKALSRSTLLICPTAHIKDEIKIRSSATESLEAWPLGKSTAPMQDHIENAARTIETTVLETLRKRMRNRMHGPMGECGHA